jgi:hypothetical protein
MYDSWLGQFSFRLRPALVVPSSAPWAVKAYKFTGGQWVEMTQYSRTYPDSNYVGTYFNELCRIGRGLAASWFVRLFSPTSTPVIVRLFHFDSGQWNVREECRK